MPYYFLFIFLAFTQTTGVIAVCSMVKKKILNKDGTITEKEFLPINATIDHRIMDGVTGAKMIKEVFIFILIRAMYRKNRLLVLIFSFISQKNRVSLNFSIKLKYSRKLYLLKKPKRKSN